MIKEGTLNPAYFKNPPLYTYAILLTLYGMFSVRYLMGYSGSRAHFIATLPPDLPFVIARGLSALAGTATCLVLFVIGKKFGGDLAGLLAALFYSVAFFSVKDGHFGTNDVPMVCLVTLAFFFAVRLFEGGTTPDLIVGGLTAGLAAATKYNGGIALVPLFLACVLGQRRQGGASNTGRMREVAIKWLALLLLALAGFLLGNPYAVLDNDAFVSAMTSRFELLERIWPGQSEAPVLLLALQTLVVELGWPLLLLVPCAASVCLTRGGALAKATGLALSLVLPLILYHLSKAFFMARFLLPCTPFLALICAWGIVAVREVNWVSWARHRVVFGAAMALLVASPLARSLYLDLLLQRPDTRLLANEYLEGVARPGSVIVRETESLYAPPFHPRRYRVLFLKHAPSLLYPAGGAADFYVFNSFDVGQVPGVSEAEERLLMDALEHSGFARMTFSPLRDGGGLWVEREMNFRSYRHLFRYERPGPAIVIYARPGIPVAEPSSG